MKKLLYILVLSGFVFACNSSVDPKSSEAIGNTGKGGSTARFTIAKDYLYIVDNQSLKVYDIKTTDNPVYLKKVPLNTVVETIFPFNNYLLVGTQTGMFIFDITTPETPQKVSVYSHIVSCDPVVADGNYAYVTLRSGTSCQRGINALDVIDIKNMLNPKLVKSYAMENPHGLGADGNLLFVTEGNYGLKVFDKSNPLELKEIESFKNFNAMDVIPEKKVLIITGKDGIYQYSYDTQKELKLLSKIPIDS